MNIKQEQTSTEVLEVEDFNNPGHYTDRSTWLIPNSCGIKIGRINTTTFGTNGWTSGIPGAKTVTINISYASPSEIRLFIFTAPSQPFGVKYYRSGKVKGSGYWSFNANLSKDNNMIISSGEINSEILP